MHISAIPPGAVARIRLAIGKPESRASTAVNRRGDRHGDRDTYQHRRRENAVRIGANGAGSARRVRSRASTSAHVRPPASASMGAQMQLPPLVSVDDHRERPNTPERIRHSGRLRASAQAPPMPRSSASLPQDTGNVGGFNQPAAVGAGIGQGGRHHIDHRENAQRLRQRDVIGPRAKAPRAMTRVDLETPPSARRSASPRRPQRHAEKAQVRRVTTVVSSRRWRRRPDKGRCRPLRPSSCHRAAGR